MRAKDVVLYGKCLTCRNCGGSKGTLMKARGGEYRHQDPKACEIQRLYGKRAKADKRHKKRLLAARKPLVKLP